MAGFFFFFFFFLDDPFTAIDSTRRAAAIRAIGAFEENHQVLFHTCHPDHAGELQELAGAKTLMVTEWSIGRPNTRPRASP